MANVTRHYHTGMPEPCEVDDEQWNIPALVGNVLFLGTALLLLIVAVLLVPVR